MKRFTKEQIEQIVEMYQSGKSTPKIGKLFNCHATTILGILRRNGVKLRNLTEANFIRYDSNKEKSLIKAKFLKSIRTLPENTFWKAKCLVRDNFTCQKCGIYNSPQNPPVQIQVDHINPFYKIMADSSITTLQEARECVELWDENNGRTLCKKCHVEETDWEWAKSKD